MHVFIPLTQRWQQANARDNVPDWYALTQYLDEMSEWGQRATPTCTVVLDFEFLRDIASIRCDMAAAGCAADDWNDDMIAAEQAA